MLNSSIVERLRQHPRQRCRRRQCRDDRWSVASSSSSHERYDDTLCETGQDSGTLEEGFEIGAMSLHDTWDGTMTEDEHAWQIT